MDQDIDRDLTRWPHSAGSGPFRTKGVTYLGHLEYVAEHIAGGVAAQNAALKPQTRTFFQKGFLRGNWYDLAPLIEAGQVCAQLKGVDFRTFVRTRSIAQAERDLGGVYHYLARLAGPRRVADRVTTTFGLYFDFISVSRLAKSEVLLEFRLDGIPLQLMMPWFEAALPAYIEHVTKVAGQLAQTSFGRINVSGTRDGLMLASAVISMRYPPR